MTETDSIFDVIVIGAGAAGMVCGFRAAENGRRTLVLEKNRKVGAKILMSGGTRCNVTHNTDRNGIVKAFGKNGKFLHSSLAVLSPEQVVEMFNDLGVPTKVESTGKIFPASNKALHVQQALLSRLEQSGCQLRNQSPVISIKKIEEHPETRFEVITENEQFHCKKLVVACGGKSFPGCGTTGDGYAWAKEFGHKIIDTFPALVPIVCSSNWVSDMKGISIQDSIVSIVESKDLPASADWQQAKNVLKKKSLSTSQTAVLFTHFGLSGPAAMNVSKAISSHSSPTDLLAVVNLAPQIPLDDWPSIFDDWRKEKGQGLVGRAVAKYCGNDIADRLWAKVFEFAGLSREKTIAEVSKKEFQNLVRQIHFLTIPVQGTLGFEKAEVTTGGVSLKEVNPKTLESKKCPGLYLIGEILDLDGWIGGYNFQSAFSTGWTAGDHV